MRLKSLVIAAAAAGLLAPAFAQAQAQFKDGDWMVRVRAVDLLFQNGQLNECRGLSPLKIQKHLMKFGL